MKKAELIKALEQLGDDDEIYVRQFTHDYLGRIDYYKPLFADTRLVSTNSYDGRLFTLRDELANDCETKEIFVLE